MKERVRSTRENSCGYLVKQMAWRMDREMTEELREHGLDVRHFASLMTLLEEDNLTQTELGRRVGNPQYTTSRVVDSLEEKGLVQRREHPSSRRAHRVALTESGRALGTVLPDIVRRVNERSLQNLSRKERLELVRLLRKALDV